MTEYTHRCSNISRKFSIGSSSQGRKLWVLEISDKPGQQEPEPNFKYIANMHGDETSGRMLLPMLAEWLCDSWQGGDQRAARIVKDMHLYLMPTMNPDGFALHQRENGNGVDLNRNFPDGHVLCTPDEDHCDVSMLQKTDGVQPEVAAVMRWIEGANAKSPTDVVHFTASANLHEGSVVANYPYDAYSRTSRAKIDALAAASQQASTMQRPDVGPGVAAINAQQRVVSAQGAASVSPDDATFKFMAHTYANAHRTMHDSTEFPGGITNGAAWYEILGGMQDWNYIAAKCMEITLELSNTKYPPASTLPQLWDDNRDALIALAVSSALGGVTGTVTSTAARRNAGAAETPLPATISVQGISWKTTAHLPFGFYARPLAPGQYTITASYGGYASVSKAVTVPADGSGARLDFKLRPLK
eukprot:GHUV01026540.1.p1 GENE.GHUV01026540.1~~GHUV01026540.1.p1  ORF type:complete len:416 (+),score=69.75 GHUV01026540.1:694-1941(+)